MRAGPLSWRARHHVNTGNSRAEGLVSEKAHGRNIGKLPREPLRDHPYLQYHSANLAKTSSLLTFPYRDFSSMDADFPMILHENFVLNSL